MKVILAAILLLSVAAPLSGQELSDIEGARRVKVSTTDHVIVGTWVGVKDSIAAVSQNARLVQLRIPDIESVHLFRSSSAKVGLASGIAVGSLVGITFGMYLAGTCSSDCVGGSILGGAAAFLVSGGAAGVAGALIGSAIGVGSWQEYYQRQK